MYKKKKKTIDHIVNRELRVITVKSYSDPQPQQKHYIIYNIHTMSF